MNYRIQEIEPEVFLIQYQDNNIWRYLYKDCVSETFPAYIVKGYPVLMFSSLRQAIEYAGHYERMKDYKPRYYNILAELVNG